MLDRSVFIAKSGSTPPLREVPSIPTIPNQSLSLELDHNRGLSPNATFHLRTPSTVLREATSSPALNSPTRRNVESVYDRFLMATSGVKRVGRGYQSDNTAPQYNVPNVVAFKKSGKLFGTARRAMPPPVSSEDINIVDEHGNMSPGPQVSLAQYKEDSSTVRVVTKALKAIVTGKTVTRRHSKLV